MRLIMGLAAAVLMTGSVHAGSPPEWGVQQALPAPVIVYFDVDSDASSPNARALLTQAARTYRDAGDLQVTIAGHADLTEGSPAEAVRLSQRRAARVREVLAAMGVPDGVMTTHGFGKTRPALEAEAEVVRIDGKLESVVRAQQGNRRVEVTFGPGSGW